MSVYEHVAVSCVALQIKFLVNRLHDLFSTLGTCGQSSTTTLDLKVFTLLIFSKVKSSPT